MAERISMETTIDGRLIIIKPLKIWPVALFLLVWVSGWTFGGYEAFKAFSHSIATFKLAMLPVLIFLGVWLIGWAAGEAAAVLGIA